MGFVQRSERRRQSDSYIADRSLMDHWKETPRDQAGQGDRQTQRQLTGGGDRAEEETQLTSRGRNKLTGRAVHSVLWGGI